MENMTNQPSFVYREGVIADKKYVEWLSEVKARFSETKYEALMILN